jgi:hypothetical protein
MSLTPILSILCSTLLGAVFLLTGGIKALAPSLVFDYFAKLGVRDLRQLRILVWLSAVGECLLGVALLVRAFPAWLFPGTIVLLIAFVALTLLGSKKTGDDCACYGKLLSISPAKSIALDLLYGAMTVVAWRIPVPAFLSASGQIAVLAGAAALFSAITILAHGFYLRGGKDWLDLSPLQIGRKWNQNWMQGFGAVANTEAQLIVLMSPTCPSCKRWIKPLNKIARRADMPQVIGGMAGSEEELSRAVAENGIAFPLLRMKSSVMDRIAGQFPDVVVVENGIVRAKPGARIPENLIQRLMSSIKPTAI